LARRPLFSVLSTGTRVIAMAIGEADATLGPAADRLLNVDANGHPVGTARFMAGGNLRCCSQAGRRA
jgi:hypothetical protein